MLGKLIKYELMAEFRKFAVLFIAIITVAVTFLLFDKGLSQLGDFTIIKIISGLLMTFFVILCFSAIIMVFAFSISRFYKNLFKDEGYLMHTLPVKSWEHIVSKLVAAYVWVIASILVIVAGICIVSANVEWLGKLPDYWQMFIDEINESDPVSAQVMKITLSFSIWMFILSPLFMLLYIYFCIAVGSLFNEHRILMAVVTFIGVNIVSQIISTIIMCSVGLSNYMIVDETTDMSAFIGVFNKIIVISIILSIVEYGIMAFFTNFIMSKKLNLE